MTLKSIECDPDCGFMIKSHDEKEVMDTAMRHARGMHKMNVTEAEMKKKVRVA